MPTPRLASDLERLTSAGWTLTVLCEEAGFTNVVIRGVETGVLYRPATTDILLRVPALYPDAAPDMFWTEPSVVLASGSMPKRAESLETICGRQWRRFSWHRSGRWDPNADWIGSHLEFVRQRFMTA